MRARTIDTKNPVRLIRAIEIANVTGKPIPKIVQHPTLNILQIGIKKSQEELKKLIAKRLQKRLNGMIAEIKKSRTNGLSFKRLEELGLEYRFAAQYVQSKISLDEMKGSIQKKSEQYAKRQMTWFKRDKEIHWVTTRKETATLTKKFLRQ